MNKMLLIATLLIAHAASGQVGYRSVQENKPAKKVYDSTVNIVGCGWDTASMIGQELYFAKRSPYFKDGSESDTLYSREFVADVKTTLKYPKKKIGNEPITYASLSTAMTKKR